MTTASRLGAITVMAGALAFGMSAAPPPGASADPFAALYDPFKWSFDGQALGYGNLLARTPNSLLNPGNSVVRLPNLTLTGELRPNAHATSDYVDLVLQPRLSSIYQTGGVADQETVRGYLQQGYVRAKPSNDVSVTVGRELLTWGPAFFRSPSNPYYFNNARLNPILELSGIDLARVTYAAAGNWTVTGGVVFASGQDLVAHDRYRDSVLLKADYRNVDYLGSLVLASLQRESMFVGGYAQASVNDATLVYGEFGASSASAALGVDAQSFTQDGPSRRSATALAGASYTFENGHSLYAEYLYNGFGYTGSGLHRYFSQAHLAYDTSFLGGSVGGAGAQQVGTAATRASDLLGQHYVYLQYQNNPAQGSRLWRLMSSTNVVDHSTQLSFYIEQNVSDRVSVFSLGIANLGPRNTEFGAFSRASLMVGIKLFLF